jgi:alpha-L-fucosidase
MNKLKRIFKIVCLLATVCTLFECTTVQSQQNVTIYAPTWESLAKHNTEPEWFKDAKLGIYFHWGI